MGRVAQYGARPMFRRPCDGLTRLVGRIVRQLWVVAGSVAMSVLSLFGLGPPAGAYQIRTVLTESMRPTMPEGSVVMVRPVAPSDLQVGDVITYRIPVDDRRIVTHRIVDITEPGVQPVVRTEGDANNAPDPWAARIKDEKAWRVQVSVRRVGYVLASLRQPALQQLTVLGAPALLARWMIPGLVRDRRSGASSGRFFCCSSPYPRRLWRGARGWTALRPR